MLICGVGILLGYIAGAYLSYQTIPYVFAALPLIFLGTFIFFPETPQYLLIKNDKLVCAFVFVHQTVSFTFSISIF